MNLYNMTKPALVAECQRLKSENERLQDELNNLSDYCVEMENQLAESVAVCAIKDVSAFKYRLLLDNLLTPQLESFIDDYLKYYQERSD